MEYLIGAGLALGIAMFAAMAGFDRDRAFYPAMLVVIASYYDLFAVIGGQTGALGMETLALVLFAAVSVIGFRTDLWIVAGALLAHGVFDLVHGGLIANTGVPAWWPMFCLSFDGVAGGYLAWLLGSSRLDARPGRDAGRRPTRRSRISTGTNAGARRILSIVALGGMSLTVGACSSLPSDVRTATIDGHHLTYRVLGSGKPVVVMISGLGNGMATFDGVAPDIAKGATVIIYDRAGYGGSDPIPGSRDAAAAAQELDALLKQSNIPGPYVLIGHSLGGLFAEYFAAIHPEQVSGLIFEESRPADFGKRCEAAGLLMCTPTPDMVKSASAGMKGEVAGLPQTMTEVESANLARDKPVLVLSRSVAKGPKPMDALWAADQADLAARYPGSHHLTAEHGGHYVHREQRDWFVKAVRDFLHELN